MNYILCLKKRLSDKAYYVVDVYLSYVNDPPNNFAQNLRIEIGNVYKGMTIAELKDEIDNVGDFIYQEIVNKIGKENVLIEHKEIHHRVIFF